MKTTSFRLITPYDKLNEFLNTHLKSYVDSNAVHSVEEDNGYTIYVDYDDCDMNMKELEECFMHVFLLDDHYDAWHMIKEYTI